MVSLFPACRNPTLTSTPSSSLRASTILFHPPPSLMWWCGLLPNIVMQFHMFPQLSSKINEVVFLPIVTSHSPLYISICTHIDVLILANLYMLKITVYVSNTNNSKLYQKSRANIISSQQLFPAYLKIHIIMME